MEQPRKNEVEEGTAARKVFSSHKHHFQGLHSNDQPWPQILEPITSESLIANRFFYDFMQWHFFDTHVILGPNKAFRASNIDQDLNIAKSIFSLVQCS